MEIFLNDLVFEYKTHSFHDIYELVKKFVETIIKLQESRKDFQLVFDKNNISYFELMDGYPIAKLYNDKSIPKDYRSVILRAFSKMTVIDSKGDDTFCFNNSESDLCRWAYENGYIALSMITNDIFKTPVLKGELKKKGIIIELVNLCEPLHVTIYAEKLGIRIYEPNPKHKLGHNWGSPMDLSAEVAQMVLDKSIIYDKDDKCLINYYNGNYYVFRRHINNCYHGYIDNHVPENIKMKFKDVNQ